MQVDGCIEEDLELREPEIPQEQDERQVEEMALSPETMPANKQPMAEQDEEMLAEENQRPQGLLDRW